MPDSERGTDRARRRAKRFPTPLQKHEIWLQLVRQKVTIAEAAERWEVDRATIARIRMVAKDGALAALANSRPGVKTRERDFELTCVLGQVPSGRALRDGQRPTRRGVVLILDPPIDLR